MKELKFNFSKAALKKTFAFMLAMCLCITSVGIHVEAKDAVVSYSETREQSQGDGEQSQGNGVASVTISPTSLELKEGASETLTVTVVMEDETSREITPGDAEIRVDWKSDAPEIATVDENGKVTAQKAGTTKIIATVDEQTAECTVTVTENVIQVTGVGLNKTTLSLKVGETEKLTATVVPATASYKTLTWDTSDAKTATVKDGVVTAVAKGTATITVKTVNGKTATCTVTVTEKPAAPVEATGVSLNATKLSLKTGKTATLTATVVPATASNKTITWNSNKESVATVSNAGVVTAKGNGTATITAKTVNGKTATCTVTVTTDATKVTLDNTKLTLAVGKSKTLKATINPSTTSNKALTWKSSDKKVATVDKKGKVTAKKAGTATITVTTANGKTATCKVTVAEVKLNASTIAVQKGKSTSALKVASTYLKKDTVKSWTSSNTKIATVDKKGKITGKKVGKATITVTMKSGATATCKVTVQKGKVVTKSLSISAKEVTLQKGKTTTLTVTRNPISATEKITWTSSNKKVATVKNGKVTAKKAGKATITAKTSNGKKVTCTVTVKNPTVTLKKTSATLKVKKSTTIQIKSKYPTNDTVKSYKSSNAKVATVNKNGKVTAKKAGKATITVTMKSGAKATFKVTVK